MVCVCGSISRPPVLLLLLMLALVVILVVAWRTQLLSRHSELEQSETKAQAALITVLSLTPNHRVETVTGYRSPGTSVLRLRVGDARRLHLSRDIHRYHYHLHRQSSLLPGMNCITLFLPFSLQFLRIIAVLHRPLVQLCSVRRCVSCWFDVRLLSTSPRL